MVYKPGSVDLALPFPKMRSRAQMLKNDLGPKETLPTVGAAGSYRLILPSWPTTNRADRAHLRIGVRSLGNLNLVG